MLVALEIKVKKPPVAMVPAVGFTVPVTCMVFPSVIVCDALFKVNDASLLVVPEVVWSRKILLPSAPEPPITKLELAFAIKQLFTSVVKVPFMVKVLVPIAKSPRVRESAVCTCNEFPSVNERVFPPRLTVKFASLFEVPFVV